MFIITLRLFKQIFVFLFCIVIFIGFAQSQKVNQSSINSSPATLKTPSRKAGASTDRKITIPRSVISFRVTKFILVSQGLGSSTTDKQVMIELPNNKFIICKILISESNRVTVEISAQDIKKLIPGFYSVKLKYKSVLYDVYTKLKFIGLTGFEVRSNIKSGNVMGILNTPNSLLTIRGAGFGTYFSSNVVKIGLKPRAIYTINNFKVWNDTVVQLLLPANTRRGYAYPVQVKNTKGFIIESNLKDSATFFNYPGIVSVEVYRDSARSYVGEAKGIGFGEKIVGGALYLNELKMTDIVSWTPTSIKFRTNFIRTGRYAPSIVIPGGRAEKTEKVSKWSKRTKRVVEGNVKIYANDSVDIASDIEYTDKRIWGSYYALSLRASKDPEQKLKNYTSFIYTLPKDAKVQLDFYSVDGKRHIASLITGEKNHLKGRYELRFTTSDMLYGKYILILSVDDNIKIPCAFIR